MQFEALRQTLIELYPTAGITDSDTPAEVDSKILAFRASTASNETNAADEEDQNANGALETRIAALESQLESLPTNEAVSNLQTAVRSLTNIVTGIRESSNALYTTVNDATDAIASIQSQLDGNTNALDSVSDIVDDIQRSDSAQNTSADSNSEVTMSLSDIMQLASTPSNIKGL